VGVARGIGRIKGRHGRRWLSFLVSFLVFGLLAVTSRERWVSAADAPPPARQEVVLSAPPELPPLSSYGAAVAVSGTVAAVGAPWEEVALGRRKGAVYMFQRQGPAWVLQQKLTPTIDEPTSSNLHFGVAVAISGNTLIVGSATDALVENGVAYAFVRKGPRWTQQGVMRPDEAGPNTGVTFGVSVAIDGDTAIVGNPRHGRRAALDGYAGSAYVFVRAGDEWTKQQKLTLGEPTPDMCVEDDLFGAAVGVSKDVAIIGAPHDGHCVGAAYVYARTGGAWSATPQKLLGDVEIEPQDPFGNAVVDDFGRSVAINGRYALVGAPHATGVIEHPGAAYVYTGDGTAWSRQAKLSAQDVPFPRNAFGQSVAINAATAIVGASLIERTYTFVRNQTNWPQQGILQPQGNHSYFGASVGLSGDTIIGGGGGPPAIFQELDSDGDGLPDEWETRGISVDTSGHVLALGASTEGTFLNLPAMGADPRHKDLFVHADWMATDASLPGRTFKPTARVVKMVRDAFAAAPVKNPDGRPGVSLHVDLGPDSVMDTRGGEKKWMGLSTAGEVPFQASTLTAGSDGSLDWSALEAVKAFQFRPSGRQAVFRYVLFGNKIATFDNTGLARDLPGTDFIIAMGSLSVQSEPLELATAGTFMHELGHSLGLLHGGGDNVSRKPNYLSVMNYLFQLPGLLRYGKQRSIDFSRAKLPTLNELALAEAEGIQGPPQTVTIFNKYSRWNFPEGASKCLGRDNEDLYYLRFLPGPALDWDCDGMVTPALTEADVNGDSICVSPADGLPLLTTPEASDDSQNGRIVAGPDRLCVTKAVGTDIQENDVGSYAPVQLEGFDDWASLVYAGDGKLGNRFGVDDSGRARTPMDEKPLAVLRASTPASLFEEERFAPKDVVTFSSPGGGAPLTATFDGGASLAARGTIVGWSWDFGDGATGNGATATHTYTAPGEYFARLTVTDSFGGVNLVPLLTLVTVTNEPSRPVDAGADDGPSSPTEHDASVDVARVTDGGLASTDVGVPDVASLDGPRLPGADAGALATGYLDLTFRATVSNLGGATINKVIRQPDGKLIVGGHFKSFAGCARRNIARVNSDGSCDETFDPGLVLTEVFDIVSDGITTDGTNRLPLDVQALALQPDGKILVGVNGATGFLGGAFRFSKLILRLNANGSLDTSFDTAALNLGTNVYAIAVQPDGKILVGGNFTYTSRGARVYSLLRLDPNGALDPSFALVEGPSFNEPKEAGTVAALAVQPDGKIVIGGSFVHLSGVDIINFARLNGDGSLDATFNATNASTRRATSGISRGATFAAIFVQPDGRILAGGSLGSDESTSVSGPGRAVARFAADGTREASFSGSSILNQGTGLALQPDGKIIVVGTFQITEPAPRAAVARLNGDGTLDTTFEAPGLVASGPLDVALEPDGHLTVVGAFGNKEGAASEGLVRLAPNGQPDPAFAPNGAGSDARVNTLVRQTDGKLLVGFMPYAGLTETATRLNAVKRGGIGRLAADGTTDTSFASPFTAASAIFGIAAQPDGKVVAWGTFKLMGSSEERELVRLQSNGALDPTFATPGDGSHFGVFALQPDGKIIAAKTRSGEGYLVRLNADGTPDATFSVDLGNARGVDRLLIQPDGRVIAAGLFVGVGDRDARLGRFNADGSLDTTFDPGAGPDDRVRALALQPDGRLLIGGWFHNVDGKPRPCLARLNADGSLDATYVPVNVDSNRLGNPRHVGALALLSNGQLLVGNEVADDNLLPPNRVFRLDAHGALDTSFALGTGLEGTLGAQVNALAVVDDDTLVVGGQFDVVNGVARLGLARLVDSAAGPAAPSPGKSGGGCSCTAAGSPSGNEHEPLVVLTAVMAVVALWLRRSSDRRARTSASRPESSKTRVPGAHCTQENTAEPGSALV